MKLLLVAVFVTAAAAVLTVAEAQVFPDEPGEALANDHHQVKGDDMEMLLSRSRWCRRRDGVCRNPRKHTCDRGNQESPMGRPYCMGRNRRCCYPVETTLSSTTTISTTTFTPGCPTDTFTLPYSNECFKLSERRIQWSDASSYCTSLGMEFARPSDDIAVNLRKYLLDNYGTQYIWVAGRGDGTKQVWVRSGTPVLPSLLYPGADKEGQTDRCLSIYAFESGVNYAPNRPYTTYYCTDTRVVICEVVV